MKFFRFLYINIFAFVLVGLSVLIFIMPEGIFLKILKIICALLPLAGGIGIFSQWKAKSRKLKILVARNRKGIRLDTFERLRETLCGWLVVSLALQDLRKMENHRSFSKEDWEDIRLTVLGLKNMSTKCRKMRGRQN